MHIDPNTILSDEDISDIFERANSQAFNYSKSAREDIFRLLFAIRECKTILKGFQHQGEQAFPLSTRPKHLFSIDDE